MESNQSLNLIHSQKSRFFVPLVVNAIILCIVGVVMSTVVVSTKCLLSKASHKDNLASLPTSLPLPPHLPLQMPAIDFSLSTPMDTPSALLMPKKIPPSPKPTPLPTTASTNLPSGQPLSKPLPSQSTMVPLLSDSIAFPSF